MSSKSPKSSASTSPATSARRWPWVVVALGLIGLLAVAALALWAQEGFFAPYPGTEPIIGTTTEARQLTIKSGSGASQILRQLEEGGVLADALLARLFLVYRLGDPPLRAGEYKFKGNATGPEVLAQLIEGRVLTHKVTIIEGLTLEETADHLTRSGFGDLETFLAAMRSPALIRDFDPAADDLEGYLFPDTYAFARGTREEEIVATLVRTFHQRWKHKVEPLLARELSRGIRMGTPTGNRELLILASIIEKEAGATGERPLVAAVYANRLTRGIALYADPTIIFALKRSGNWDGNLRRKDLRMDSPYNTYRYPGLPPGPIASPGLASLRAAAAPADEPFLYFVSRNDGTHVFARTLAEHNRNVQRWQRLYWSQRRAEERRAKASTP